MSIVSRGTRRAASAGVFGTCGAARAPAVVLVFLTVLSAACGGGRSGQPTDGGVRDTLPNGTPRVSYGALETAAEASLVTGRVMSSSRISTTH